MRGEGRSRASLEAPRAPAKFVIAPKEKRRGAALLRCSPGASLSWCSLPNRIAPLVRPAITADSLPPTVRQRDEMLWGPLATSRREAGSPLGVGAVRCITRPLRNRPDHSGQHKSVATRNFFSPRGNMGKVKRISFVPDDALTSRWETTVEAIRVAMRLPVSEATVVRSLVEEFIRAANNHPVGKLFPSFRIVPAADDPGLALVAESPPTPAPVGAEGAAGPGRPSGSHPAPARRRSA